MKISTTTKQLISKNLLAAIVIVAFDEIAAIRAVSTNNWLVDWDCNQLNSYEQLPSLLSITFSIL